MSKVHNYKSVQYGPYCMDQTLLLSLNFLTTKRRRVDIFWITVIVQKMTGFKTRCRCPF